MLSAWPKKTKAAISGFEHRVGLDSYPLWLRYLAAALILVAASGSLIMLGKGSGFGVVDTLKYITLVASLLFICRALWRIQQKESNLYYGNFLSQVNLFMASRRERMKLAIVACAALMIGVAYLCFALGALLYALASDGIYNPFSGKVEFGSVLLFIFDQALKGMLFDFMEIFSINLSELTVNADEKWFFGSFLVVFRLFFSVIVIGAFIAYVFERGMKLAGYKVSKP